MKKQYKKYSSFWPYLLHPNNWIIALVYIIIRALILLPYPVLMSLGKYLGILTQLMLKKRQLIVKINIHHCFPELSDKEKANLIRKNWIATGRGFFESALAWWASDRRMKKLLHLPAQGYEHLEEAISINRGALILNGHFTNMELAGRFLAMSYKNVPVNVVYRKNNNPFIDYLIDSGRRRFYHDTIEKREVKKLFKYLKNGEIVCYMTDQNTGRHMVFAPFFGIKAATVTAAPTIAKRTKAIVIPGGCYCLPDRTGYQLLFFPTLTDFPSDNKVFDITQINKAIETIVRLQPENYFWLHRRFRTRPPGEPTFY